MLDLGPSGSAADAYHQRFQDESLPEALSRRAFAAFDRAAYDERSLEGGREIWRHRALDEYRSQVAFTELLALLTELGVPFDILGTCVRLVRDEARHVELCRRMVRALGGRAVIPGDPRWVRADRSLSLRSQVLKITAESLCVGETLSMRLLAAATPYIQDPLARAANACFVRDEAIHSRFGWTLLQHLWPGATARERQGVREGLPATLAAAQALVGAASGDPSRGKNPFGALPDRVRDRVFKCALERDVRAAFQRLGI